MVRLPTGKLGLIVKEGVNNIKVAFLCCDMQTCCALVRCNIVYPILAKFIDYFTVIINTSIIESIKSEQVNLLEIGSLVLDDHLRYYLVPETADEHERRHAVTRYRKVHVNWHIEGTEIQQILIIIVVYSANDFLLPRGQVHVDLGLIDEIFPIILVLCGIHNVIFELIFNLKL